MSVTREELAFAHKQGYEIHVIDACVCRDTANIYEKYIFEAYERRLKYKRLAKEALEAGDMETYCKYEIK